MAFLLAIEKAAAMLARILVVYMTLLSGAGCAHQARVELPNLRIPVDCASEIKLVGCDARVSPPKCRSARVTYRRGCEEIEVRK